MFRYLLYRFFTFPYFILYRIYDFLYLFYTKRLKSYYGYGIHLFVGPFGSGKTWSAVYKAFLLCKKHCDVNILTNLQLSNFPEHTNILQLHNVNDIINAPNNTIVIVDEIGTIFNSRDFSGGDRLPKSLYQHLCQCRKRNISIWGTVQRYNLLDKQIRDITADVTVCRSNSSYPYTRYIRTSTYDIDDYEMYISNRSYVPKPINFSCYFQSNISRNLYDTKQLIDNMLKDKYISDDDILKNRGDFSYNFTPISKKDSVAIRHRNRL